MLYVIKYSIEVFWQLRSWP